MCGAGRKGDRLKRAVTVAIGLGVLITPGLAGAQAGGGRDGSSQRTPATERAARRLYDGAPPVIAHRPFGMGCEECHGVQGLEVPGAGFAPPSPHAITTGIGASANCVQCHVWKTTDEEFRTSRFEGLAQDLRRGRRLTRWAPPVMPHAAFMRENCRACHAGPAVREEIRTSHPERENCRQCHVERVTDVEFVRSAD